MSDVDLWTQQTVITDRPQTAEKMGVADNINGDQCNMQIIHNELRYWGRYDDVIIYFDCFGALPTPPPAPSVRFGFTCRNSADQNH